MAKDHKKSRREENDHGSRDRDRDCSKTTDTTREKEKEVYKDKERRLSRDGREDTEEHDKDKHNRDKVKEKEKDYDQRGDRYRDKDHERERDRDRDKDKDHKDRVKDRDRERERETEKRDRKYKDKEKKDRDRDKDGDRGREKHKDRDREKEKGKGKDRERDRKTDGDSNERSKDKDKLSGKNREGGHDGAKDEKGIQQEVDDSTTLEHKHKNDAAVDGRQQSSSELEKRILEMKEERLRRKTEGVPEILAWVSKSRKLEEKSDKEKALHLSKVFEEQDNIVLGEAEDEEQAQHTIKDLAGVKVLHGLDKVIEGGAVVLTLKDQNILADGDINSEVDVLENVEIGEQKQRDDAYKAAKKKAGAYEDKFSNDMGAEKRILPQYDDPVEDEGVTLDESGRFTGKAEQKLEELRKRIQGLPTNSGFEDLNASGKISSDYYTQEEMLQFKKPKKKKSLRKRDKLDLDAMEAEAVSAGLGVGDLGSRKDGKRQAAREEQEKSEAQMRSDAYQVAYAKAEEASRALRQEIPSTVEVEENENPVFGDEDEDLYKSLEKARKLALKKQDGAAPSGLQAVASLALASRNDVADSGTYGETQENKVVFTEMEEFVMGIQLDKEPRKPSDEDIYMDEDEDVKAPEQEGKDETGGWTEVHDSDKDERQVNEEKEEVLPDDTIHEAPIGKGVGSALKMLQARGVLNESIEWGGRNMDKKKSKLVGIHENDGPKEIHIERLDEFGRVMTPKEAFRVISHKFHGKEPGKMKKEKRIKQYQEDMKLKHMKNSDTPLQSMERMREAQARTQKPYLVLSGHVKPGQNSDPRSGFATVESLPGGLTPMLGDRKVEHFLGIKRKPDPGNSNLGPQKKPKT